MIKVRAIKPKPINDKAMNAVILAEMKTFGELMKRDVERVTSGWSGERPEWVLVNRANQFQVITGVKLANPNSKGAKKWIWADLGTPPHAIEPKSPHGVLAFQPKYQAGSKPGRLLTVQGKSSGDTVFAKHVDHPGTKPRGWTEMLRKDWQKSFERWMGTVMSKVVKVSGHGM